MTHGLTDTSAAADAIAREAMRRMSPSERVDAVLALSESIRAISLASLRARFPSE